VQHARLALPLGSQAQQRHRIPYPHSPLVLVILRGETARETAREPERESARAREQCGEREGEEDSIGFDTVRVTRESDRKDGKKAREREKRDRGGEREVFLSIKKTQEGLNEEDFFDFN
jgi:phosphopantothenoylcysteine synthetase/decarboxylase